MRLFYSTRKHLPVLELLEESPEEEQAKRTEADATIAKEGRRGRETAASVQMKELMRAARIVSNLTSKWKTRILSNAS
jgi:hypothetical protein